MTKVMQSELLELIYQHYPRGMLALSRVHVPIGELYYDDTEEHVRLIVAAARGRREYAKWSTMLDGLYARFSVQNESLHLWSGGNDPAYSARIYRPKDSENVQPEQVRASLSFHVSLLGPYYGIHDAGEPDEITQAVAKEIESTYPGYCTIPPDIGNTVVPDVDDAGAPMGEATIYTCLFSRVWTWVVPPPLPIAK